MAFVEGLLEGDERRRTSVRRADECQIIASSGGNLLAERRPHRKDYFLCRKPRDLRLRQPKRCGGGENALGAWACGRDDDGIGAAAPHCIDGTSHDSHIVWLHAALRVRTAVAHQNSGGRRACKRGSADDLDPSAHE
eukprot:3836550-Prymnesium_polylepis.2